MWVCTNNIYLGLCSWKSFSYDRNVIVGYRVHYNYIGTGSSPVTRESSVILALYIINTCEELNAKIKRDNVLNGLDFKLEKTAEGFHMRESTPNYILCQVQVQLHSW